MARIPVTSQELSYLLSTSHCSSCIVDLARKIFDTLWIDAYETPFAEVSPFPG